MNFKSPQMRLSSPKAHCSSSTVFTPAIRRNKENKIVRSLKVVYHFYFGVFIFCCFIFLFLKLSWSMFSACIRKESGQNSLRPSPNRRHCLLAESIFGYKPKIRTFECRLENYFKLIMKFFEYIINYKWHYKKISYRSVKSDFFICELTFEWSIFSDISGCESKYLGSRIVGGCFVLFSRVALTPPQPHPNDRWANWAPPITYSI